MRFRIGNLAAATIYATTILLATAGLGVSECFIASGEPVKKPEAKPAAKESDKVRDGDKGKDSDKAAPKASERSADKTPAKAEAKPEVVIENVVSVPNAEELVSKPFDYMGKNVKFNANFFAFSNLALDYKPAYRSSKTHLSFLVLRQKSHVPLSELKLAMMVPKEKDPETMMLATLKDGEPVEITGKVFSTALDEPWVEVLKLKKLKEDDKKPAAVKAQATKDNDKSKDEGKPEAKSDKSSKTDSEPASGTKSK